MIRRIPYGSEAERSAAAPALRAHLEGGGLVGYPTETVYGFGGLPSRLALERLAELKSREEQKPFLVLVRDRLEAEGLVWNEAAERLASAFWPGPLTLVLPVAGGDAAETRWPRALRGESGSVAVRATPHPGARALIEAAGGPITSTSANPPGVPPALSAAAIAGWLEELPGGEDVWILDAGALPPALPSTLVELSGDPPRILREGALARADLLRVVPEIDG